MAAITADRYPTITEPRKRAFLVAYAERGTIMKACEAAGCGRRTVYDWRDRDPEFAQALSDADADFGDRLEESALLRATEGVEEVDYWKGEIVGTRRKYSDTLLEKMLAARRPDRYGKRAEAQSDGTIQIAITPQDAIALLTKMEELTRGAGPLSPSLSASVDRSDADDMPVIEGDMRGEVTPAPHDPAHLTRPSTRDTEARSQPE